MNLRKLNLITIIGLLLFLFAEIALLFFTPRSETGQLLVVYFGMFAAYLVLYHEIKNIQKVAFFGIFFRCIAWLAFPQLSDDIYRFIWDGSLILDGVNPYWLTPTEYFTEHLDQPFESLYPKLNSAGYFSVYPIIIQTISAFGALAGNDFYLAALIIKLPLLLAEIGTIWLLPKVLMGFKISPKYSILYILNPLIIVDVLANAHFEALMIFFMLACLYSFQNNRFKLSGIALSLAVATKLIPLLFFPFLFKAVPPKFRIGYTLSFLVSTIVLFGPVLHPENLEHFFKSLLLYSNHFEFNASIYYLFRTIGFWITGYNEIALIGPLLALLTILIVIILWWKQKRESISSALNSMLWALTFYLLLATTVHPWYISTLILLAVFSRIQFPIVWSLVIFLSYNAYQEETPSTDFLYLLAEYTILAIAIFYPQTVRRLAVGTLREL
ncbi:MAG: glycosyltransferase 87 family protein [Salibacteraceae bacterium]